MKAIELQNSFGIESLKWVERPQPSPGRGEVLLKVNAVSLNYRDLLVVKGVFFPNFSIPFVPASDAAGEVVGVGPGVTRFKEGDRVTTHFIQDWQSGPFKTSYLVPDLSYIGSSLGGPLPGVLSEYVVLPEEGVVATPAYLSDEEASTLPIAALTAWQGLILGPLQSGQTLLVQGTGGVSIFALQIAKLFGARVIIISSSDEKLRRAAKLGADVTINYRSQPDWWRVAREAAEGVGVDHVIDVGGADTLNQSLKALKPTGFIAIVGLLTGIECKIDILAFLVRNARLESVTVGSRESFEKMNEFLIAKEPHPIVDRVFPWSEAAEAFHELEAGRHFGKIVLRPE